MKRQTELIEHEVVVNEKVVLKLKIPKQLSRDELEELLAKAHNTLTAF